jgi:hypothetical protein
MNKKVIHSAWDEKVKLGRAHYDAHPDLWADLGAILLNYFKRSLLSVKLALLTMLTWIPSYRIQFGGLTLTSTAFF